MTSSEIREALSGDGAKLPVLTYPAGRDDWRDPFAVEPQPRPTKGIIVAITVMASTLALSGSDAM